MRFVFEGKILVATWRYKSVDDAEINNVTVCSVFGLDGRLWYFGVSCCSVGDQFSKKKERKLSFAKAISTIPRDKRAVIWEAYKNQITYKRKSKLGGGCGKRL